MRPHRKPGFHQAWLGFPILRHVLYPIAATARAAYCWVHGVYPQYLTSLFVWQQ